MNIYESDPALEIDSTDPSALVRAAKYAHLYAGLRCQLLGETPDPRGAFYVLLSVADVEMLAPLLRADDSLRARVLADQLEASVESGRQAGFGAPEDES